MTICSTATSVYLAAMRIGAVPVPISTMLRADGAWIRNWLSTHGFHEASRGQLRRQVVMPASSQ